MGAYSMVDLDVNTLRVADGMHAKLLLKTAWTSYFANVATSASTKSAILNLVKIAITKIYKMQNKTWIISTCQGAHVSVASDWWIMQLGGWKEYWLQINTY